jgi:hypothetical protein
VCSNPKITKAAKPGCHFYFWRQPKVKPLTPESVMSDGTPSTAEALTTTRAENIKAKETIKTLRRALRYQRDQHKIECKKLRRDLRQSDLLLMVGAHELRTLREGYLRIAQEIETMMKGKHPNA